MPETTLPSAPAAVSPAAGEALDAATPTFVWDPVPGAAGYRLQIAASPRFATPLLDVDAGPVTEITLADTLEPTTEARFWRAGAVGAKEEVAWSRPIPFRLPTPEELAASREAEAELQHAEEVASRQARARISGMTAVPPPPVPPSLPPLADGETLSGAPSRTDWTRVPGMAERAHEEAMGGSAPRLVSPLGGEIVDGAAASFSWRTVPGALGYEVEIAPAEDFSGPTLRVDAGATAEVSLSGLLPTRGDRLFWRVRAHEAAGPGPWSKRGRFYAGTQDQAEAFNRRREAELDYERRLAEHEALQREAELDFVPLHERPDAVTPDGDAAYIVLMGLFGTAIVLGLLALITMLGEAVMG